MNIVLYRNISDSNVVDKTLTQIASINGFLRDGSSIIDPVITIEIANPSAINYIHIPEFNRYYYVNSIESVVTGLWELSCHVDVLMTYKEEFLQLSAVIGRQENLYNLYLEDDRLLTTCRRIYWTKSFPTRVNPATGGGSSFILTLAGGEKTSS